MDAGSRLSLICLGSYSVQVIDGCGCALMLKLVYKIKGADRTALITDAMRAAGTDVRESVLGNKNNGLKVIVEDGVAKLPDRTSFAGSVATADRLVRTMISMAGVSLIDTVKMITATPARILGISDKKGELAVGKDADIVIFDSNINITMAMIKGRIVYDGQFDRVSQPKVE